MILVAGATGRVGGMVARRLLEQNRPVRILVRNGSGFEPLVEAGAQPVIADLKDPASLERACHDIDVLITTASAGERGEPDTPRTVDLEGNRNLIDAARRASVSQFIFTSALSASEDHPVPLPRVKARTEAYLRQSGLPYTILAANGIMDRMFPLIVMGPLAAGRPVTLVGEASRRHSYVAARDLAAFAVATVGHPEAINQRLPIGGPDAVSWRDVVAAYERVLGRPIAVQHVPPGTLLTDLPPHPGLAELVSGLMAALETFDSVVEMAETSRRFGVSLTSVEAFLRAQPIPARSGARRIEGSNPA